MITALKYTNKIFKIFINQILYLSQFKYSAYYKFILSYILFYF